MTAEEQTLLQAHLDSVPTGRQRWTEGVRQTMLLFAGYLFLTIIVWSVIAWGIGQFGDYSLGMSGPYGGFGLSFLLPLCLLYAIHSAVKLARSWATQAGEMTQDMQNGQVKEVDAAVVEVKRFKEPELGFLVYFLLLPDNRILVLYDFEDCDDVAPVYLTAKAIKPCKQLKMVYTPKSNRLITHYFAGESIVANHTYEFLSPEDEWPDHLGFCDEPWGELEVFFEGR